MRTLLILLGFFFFESTLDAQISSIGLGLHTNNQYSIDFSSKEHSTGDLLFTHYLGIKSSYKDFRNSGGYIGINFLNNKKPNNGATSIGFNFDFLMKDIWYKETSFYYSGNYLYERTEKYKIPEPVFFIGMSFGKEVISLNKYTFDFTVSPKISMGSYHTWIRMDIGMRCNIDL